MSCFKIWFKIYMSCQASQYQIWYYAITMIYAMLHIWYMACFTLWCYAITCLRSDQGRSNDDQGCKCIFWKLNKSLSKIQNQDPRTFSSNANWTNYFLKIKTRSFAHFSWNGDLCKLFLPNLNLIISLIIYLQCGQ